LTDFKAFCACNGARKINEDLGLDGNINHKVELEAIIFLTKKK
jgi:hypothetical protein